MKGTAPIVTCDSDDDCTAWTMDWYEGLADNWRELMPGWHYDPYSRDDRHFCPSHVAEATR